MNLSPRPSGDEQMPDQGARVIPLFLTNPNVASPDAQTHAAVEPEIVSDGRVSERALHALGKVGVTAGEASALDAAFEANHPDYHDILLELMEGLAASGYGKEYWGEEPDSSSRGIPQQPHDQEP